MKIHEFNPIIYPYKLFVTFPENPTELNGKFKDNKDDLDFTYLKNDEYEAITQQVIEKQTENIGAIVLFYPKYNHSCKTISHEAFHVAEKIYNRIGADITDEPFAYLIGWVAECLEKVKIEYENSLLI